MTVAHDRQALDRFGSLDPATGEVIATWPVDDETTVRESVDRARVAAQWWADLGYAGRRERLLAWKGVLTRRMRQLAQLVHRENGKPVDDALLEIILTIEHVDWSARHAAKVLRPRTVRPGLLSLNQQAWLEYQPVGVVGVIGPWNYPVLTPMGSVAYALAAGNAVVFKPSELTPGIGAWLVEAFAQVVPEQPVLQLVTGFAGTGEALCRAGVGKLAFTGSTETARKVMAACAPTLTPVLIECGGKDALIVDEDADLDAAADAATWGGLAQRRPDLRRGRAGLRGRLGVRRVPAPPGRPDAGPAPGQRLGGLVRTHHHAPPARGDPRARRRTRCPGAAGRWSAGPGRSATPTSTRCCSSTSRRTPPP